MKTEQKTIGHNIATFVITGILSAYFFGLLPQCHNLKSRSAEPPVAKEIKASTPPRIESVTESRESASKKVELEVKKTVGEDPAPHKKSYVSIELPKIISGKAGNFDIYSQSIQTNIVSSMRLSGIPCEVSKSPDDYPKLFCTAYFDEVVYPIRSRGVEKHAPQFRLSITHLDPSGKYINQFDVDSELQLSYADTRASDWATIIKKTADKIPSILTSDK